jgi:hypothetical protein
MNRTPQQKFPLLFEAVKRSLLASQTLQRRIACDLAALESDLLAGLEINERAVSPLLSAVSFVDFAHRFGSLAESLPLIKKGTPELRKLKAVLAPVEVARNHLQHLREGKELSSNEKISFAVLGALTWTHGDSVFLISFTQPGKLEQASIAYDTVGQCWTAKHRFSVKNAWVDPDTILSEMECFFHWLTGKVTFSDPEFAQLQWGKPIAVTVRMTITRTPPPPNK